MAQFDYKAKKSPKEIIEGAVLAENKSAAIQKISKMGYFILSVDESKAHKEILAGKIHFFQKKVKTKDSANFTRQLSDLLEGGFTIVRALAVLREQTENEKLRSAILDVRDFCVDGNSLSSALQRHPKIFSNLFVSMVRAGETSGTLEKILKRLADYQEAQLEIQVKVRAALAYPMLMMIVGSLTIAVLLTYVIPNMLSMFGDLGQNLPLPTLILVKVTDFMKHFWWLLLAFVFGAGFAYSKIYQTDKGKQTIDRLKLKIPIAGDLIQKTEIARLTQTLSTLLQTGVPLLEALDVTSNVVTNAVIRQEVVKAATFVKEGGGIASSFDKDSVIPFFVINMIGIGEESGKLDQSLAKIAQSYERESDTAIKVMLSLLEPLLILVMGAVVGFIVIAMLLPIFEINFLAQ